MRRLNALLAAALLILLAWHGLAGSFMLLGVNAGTGKIAGWTAMALAALHGTLVFLMGLNSLEQIAARLTAEGCSSAASNGS